MSKLRNMKAMTVAASNGARFTASNENATVVNKLEYGNREYLICNKILHKCDVPEGDFFWANGLQRFGGDSPAGVLFQAAGLIWGNWLGLVRGAPILTQCRLALVSLLSTHLPTCFGVEVSVLRGSLRPNNPYVPLLYKVNGKVTADGWDDHIIQTTVIERRQL